ncbi:MAG TPA: sialidase family protein [Polyangia bacterium]|nr:sialidase family protein [Polyangia bacterium]
MARGWPIVALAWMAGCSSAAHVGPAWLDDAHIVVYGNGVTNEDCRADICQHNENVDVITWHGAIYMVHRTAKSQILGPNCSWFVYRSTDGGKTLERVGHILGPTDRDLRDPHFYTIGDELYLFGGTRLPGAPSHDNNIDAIETVFRTSDGVNWDSLGAGAPEMWTLWRPRQENGVWYSAAYHDDDSQISMFSSTDGLTWTLGATVYDVPEDSEDETEIVFMPSGAMLSLIRLDGTQDEYLGDQGRLREKVCWAMPPYDAFTCPQELDGVRLDGPVAFWWQSRLFVAARKHLQSDTDPKKRMALYEITGDFANAGTIGIKEWGEFPSAGDTAYAGVTALDDHRFYIAWYSSDIVRDENWTLGQIGETDIWQGVIDLSKLK